MAIFLKKKTQSVRFKSVNQKKEPHLLKRLVLIKPLIVLLCVLFTFIIYSHWQSVLESLDSHPINAYALTHKTRFTTNADIREALAKDEPLKGYFGQNINHIQDKLLAMSWVKDTVVRKLYPDRLSITLIEHNPIAVWNDKQLLSDQGVVFNLPKDRLETADLPKLYGPDSEGKKVLEAWIKIKADLKARDLDLISIKMDKRGAWDIRLSNNIELRLGRGEWIPKIDRFVAIFPSIVIPEGKRLSYVDLRYTEGAAVGFHPIN